MQIAIKSSMVMDKVAHTGALRELVASVARPPRRQRAAPSGFIFQDISARRQSSDVLAMVEDCGAIVVDDDLYHG